MHQTASVWRGERHLGHLHTRKLFVATPTEKWVVQNWDDDVAVLDGWVLNLAGWLEEEGIGW